ncbi:hypothetical protein [Streptomyces sp. NPDC001948]
MRVTSCSEGQHPAVDASLRGLKPQYLGLGLEQLFGRGVLQDPAPHGRAVQFLPSSAGRSRAWPGKEPVRRARSWRSLVVRAI